MSSIIKDLLLKIPSVAVTVVELVFKNREVTTYNFIYFVAVCVEKLSTGSLTSEDKLELAKTAIPVLLDVLVNRNIITKVESNIMLTDLTESIDEFSKIIQTLVDVSNNPNLINNRWKEQTVCCFPCLKKRR